MIHEKSPFPEGLKVGDFIQNCNHFGDIFFEVVNVMEPSEDSTYWMVTYVTYNKYGSQPHTEWINSATSIRRVISAEMAVPVMFKKRLRFKATFGQYDPFYGFVPCGVPLREKS